jgi:hypothetical protein
MSRQAVDNIVKSLLYEGYMLYPYRRSSLKNQHRWNFGLVYPEGVQPNRMITECLLTGAETVCVEVRFLQLSQSDCWEEAAERQIVIHDIGSTGFEFGSVRGEILVQRERVDAEVTKIRVEIINKTRREPGVKDLLQCLVSTHTILTIDEGEFVSLLDPPPQLQRAAAECRNVGTWPVLVGRAPERKCMLSSPIILYDYPQVAPESPGDLFDCTEIDEILTLRILTLTDEEKDAMRRSGERERRLLERAESLTPEQRLLLHGTMRNQRAGLKRGDRVRLRPKPGGDVLDVVLRDRTAIVESIEEDFENRLHVAVVIEDDPGKDLGIARQIAHRFFFSTDEVELLP